jgi:hypothetical protein
VVALVKRPISLFSRTARAMSDVGCFGFAQHRFGFLDGRGAFANGAAVVLILLFGEGWAGAVETADVGAARLADRVGFCKIKIGGPIGTFFILTSRIFIRSAPPCQIIKTIDRSD